MRLKTRAFLGFVLFFVVMGVVSTNASRRVRDLHYPGRAYNDQNYELAVEGYREYLKKYDRETELARFWLAESYRQLGQYRKAYEAYQRMREKGLKYRPGKTLQRQADAAREIGRLTEFLASLNQDHLVQYPSLQDFAVDYASRADSEGVVKKWADYFREIPVDRRRDNTRKFLSEYERIRKRNQTLRQVQSGRIPADWKTFQSFPERKRRQLLETGASNLLDEKRYDQLVEFVEAVPKPRPELLNLYRARALRELGSRDRVLGAYRKLFGTQYDTRARFAMATILRERERPREAIDLLKGVDPGGESNLAGRFYFLRGRLQEELDRPRQAAESFQRAHRRTDDRNLSARARFEEARMRSRLGQHERVLEVIAGLGEQDPVPPDGLFALRGHALLAQGNYESAAQSYARAVKRAEGRRRDSYQHDRAVARLQNGEPQRALELLETVKVSRASADLKMSVLLTRVRALAEAGRFESLLKQLRGTDRFRREHPLEFHYFRGVARARTGRYSKARQDLTVVLQEFGNTSYARAARPVHARALAESLDPSKPDSHKQLSQRLARLDPSESARVRFVWASRLQSAGQTSRARTLLEKMYRNAPDPSWRAEALLKLVRLDLQNNSPDNAAQYVRSADDSLRSRESFGRALYLLMQRDYSGGRHERASRWARIYREQGFDRNRTFATFVLAERAFGQENDTRAQNLYNTVLNQDPTGLTRESSLYRLAVLRYEAGEFDQAARYLDRVGTPETMDSQPFHALYGRVLFERRQFDRAAQHLANLEQPSTEERLYYAESLARIGRLETALKQLEGVSTSGESHQPWISLARGLIEHRRGKNQAAEDRLLRSLYRYPDWMGRDRILYLLVQINRDQDDKDEAAKYAERLRSNFPTSPWTSQLSDGGGTG